MQGWIKLHRELINKAIWQESTPEQKAILITLLMMANHQEKEWEWKGQKYKAEPGQFVTSLESIARKCGKGISMQNVRTAINRFEKYEFLTNESTNKNRLITIVNWEAYQSNNEEVTSKLTSNQQATNKQLTTNKNDKNNKNDKKVYKYTDDSVPYQAALYLRGKILENNPNARLPNETLKDLQSWADTMRKILEIDKRPKDELARVIQYAMKEDFWCTVIQSPTSLRKSYDKMFMQMDRKSSKKKSDTFQDKVDNLQKWVKGG